jgi:hypothetical protein
MSLMSMIKDILNKNKNEKQQYAKLKEQVKDIKHSYAGPRFDPYITYKEE